MNEINFGNYPYMLETGDCFELLKKLPSNSIDCVITSPPYWKQRVYEDYSGEMLNIIGTEDTPNEYVQNLITIFKEVKRVLKNNGSFWLNIGDKFHNKNLMGMPWRVALAMQDDGWILRNDIIWDQMKGTQSAKDRFRDIYEHVFHFVKEKKNYYFDDVSIRIKPTKQAYDNNGSITSATGVSGKKYFSQIENSNVLSEKEKENAKNALNEALEMLRKGEIVDFRMTIRGEQRTYHSSNKKISGRAKELEDKGYYIIKMGADGYLPSNIWRIVPEDKWRKDAHCAVFPEELLKIPILSTCPKGGIVLDPFSGTGSTVEAAVLHGRYGIGYDISAQYTEFAKNRLHGSTI